MKRLFLLLMSLMLCVPMYAAEQSTLPFTFEGVTNKTLTQAQLNAAEKAHTEGIADAAKNTLTFSQKEITLVAQTGAGDKEFTFVVQGLVNPTIIVPNDARVKVLFVDGGRMHHNFRLGDVNPPFAKNPGTANTAGSDVLAAAQDGTFAAQEFTYGLHQKGTLHYYCSVGAHAAHGMYGTLVVR